MRKLCLVILGMVLAVGCCKKEGQEAGKEEARPAVKLGQALVGADAVAVEELLKNPAAYQGKIVRVSGEVLDYCHHQRAWFGVSTADKISMVRVFAAPRFEAPADCKGKVAVAEGKVDLITISPEEARHFGKEHKFLTAEQVASGQPVQLPIVRAFGAEFR